MSGGLDYRQGGPFTSPDDILIDENFAQQRKLTVGDTVELANHNWTVRGIVGPGKLSKAFVKKRSCRISPRIMTRSQWSMSRWMIRRNLGAALANLKKVLPDYQIYSMDEFLSLITPDNVPGLNAFIMTVVGLAVVFGFLVVFLAMYTAVLEGHVR